MSDAASTGPHAAMTGNCHGYPLCESCRLRPATGTVALGFAVPFAVCDGCRPTASTTSTASPPSPIEPALASHIPI
jgi:hypothetical protein